jgi:hypothetical protein
MWMPGPQIRWHLSQAEPSWPRATSWATANTRVFPAIYASFRPLYHAANPGFVASDHPDRASSGRDAPRHRALSLVGSSVYNTPVQTENNQRKILALTTSNIRLNLSTASVSGMEGH